MELGEIAALSLGDDCAIALSRGRHPKGYAYLDPNEDAVGAAVDRETWLLAVVDGHWGFEAAQAALSAVMANSGPMSETDPHEVIAERFNSAAVAVAQAIDAAEGRRRDSRTTLTVAIVRGIEVSSATLGDSVAVLVTDDQIRQLRPASAGFLGPGTEVSRISVETVEASPGDVVVVCTDGLTAFLGRGWADELAELVREQTDPQQMVTSAIEAAFAGGAGDNIAVAALRL